MGKLDLKRLRKQRAEIAQRSGRGNFWKTGPGTNIVRLMLWNSAQTGNFEFFRPITMHQERGTPPVICGRSVARDGRAGSDCDKCDHADAVRQEDGREAASGFKAKIRYVLNVVPLVKGDEKFKQRRVYPYWAPKILGEQIIKIISDCDECESADDYFGPKGLDFKITYNPKAAPVAMYSVKVLPKVKSEELDPALFKKFTDLYEDDALEPAWYLAEKGPAEDKPEPEDEPEESDDEPEPEVDDEPEEKPEANEPEVDYEGNPCPEEGTVLRPDADGDLIWSYTKDEIEALIKKHRRGKKWAAEETDEGLGYFDPLVEGEDPSFTIPWK
jgi:hypothetical protein